MNTDKLFLVISREFLIRVKKKSFILLTILTPIFMALLVVMPTVIMTMSSGEEGQKIMVVDKSGECEKFFISDKEYVYQFDANADIESLKKGIENSDFYAIVEISQMDSVGNVSVSAYAKKQINIDTKEEIEKCVEKGVRERKISGYDIQNLDSIIKDINTDVNVRTFIVSEQGKEKSGMVEINMAISYIASFLIYMFIFMFGSMVMRGVIDEKSNRVVEVIVSSVKPFELMLGKILGVGAVALLQFLIWILLTVGIVFGAQAIMGVDLSAASSSVPGAVPEGVPVAGGAMGDIFAALAGLNYVYIVLSFLAYFLLGYLLYASMFAAVGSAVDNEADTQQLTLPVTLPLIIGLFIMIHTFRFPDSALSFWGSMIPFTSPMVMMARVPFGVPAWELALSIALLVLTFLFMTFLSGKIYRVGILSYGKKATWKDLMKWLRY
ncbi:MAG: ABC transporter permease [Bacteroidales bacterium]|nr:ABC transporter permease [Bacteroidales bacterium]